VFDMINERNVSRRFSTVKSNYSWLPSCINRMLPWKNSIYVETYMEIVKVLP
jgi:hypothetical protein